MKIAMLGSLGNINRLVIPRLVALGHDVTVVTTSVKRRAAIESMGARAAVGTMRDVDFLTTTFTGQDVVYLMLSGGVGDDPFTSAVAQARIWKQALSTAGVRNVVDLSSVGADADEVAGSLHAYNLIEGILKTIPDLNLAFARPGFTPTYSPTWPPSALNTPSTPITPPTWSKNTLRQATSLTSCFP